ncbi:MAG: DUF1775 domain-containing protein [Rhodospirillaceae bacterium]|nr:DUF1775 domain-containing protein [Rhodospirillaceae bacterium]
MLKPSLLAAVAAVALATPALAHNALDLKEAYAGYSTPMVLSVNHGCKAKPVVGLRLKVPDGIVDAKAAFDPNWTIEYKMRKLDKPIEMHGRPVTEVVDEIVWKDPVKTVPADGWYPFQFRMTIPETPGKVLHIKNITVCPDATDPYVDMPSAELDINDPEFAKKTWAFMTATPGPAPFLVIRAPEKKQYPWEWTSEQAKGASPSQEAMAK